MRWIVLLVVALAGCVSDAGRVSARPLSWDEQRMAVLEIAPLGTPRDEVADRLERAGIEFSPSGETGQWTPGMETSIFYCDRWSHSGDDPETLDLALLFDDQGRLYELRRANAEVSAVELLPSSPGPTALAAEGK